MFAGRDWLWLGLLSLAAVALPERLVALLEYRREAILDGELWRLLSGHGVYYSTRHALLDGGMLVLLAHALGGRVLPWLLLCGLALSAFLLLATPDMVSYRGASGLVMAMAGLLLGRLWQSRPRWRPALVAVAVLLCGKITADALLPGTSPAGLPDGIRVAWQAHAAGLAFGLVAAGLEKKLSGRAAA